MATLVNGNGNVAVYAQQDADLLTGALGASTRIMNVGSKMAYTIEDANTIAVADGVILTKEGRRIQVDVGNVDEFTIPTGSAGVTRYYIIGYHLYTDGSANQKCETFVQLMSNGSETITENTFRNGASEVYVSLYRVKQIGLNLDTITALLSVGIALTDMTDVIGDTDISGIGDGTLTGGLNAVNQNLTELINNDNIRYDEDTDYIQIKVNGVWTDWKRAYMQIHAVFIDGEFENEHTIGGAVTNPGLTQRGVVSKSGNVLVLNTPGTTSSITGSAISPQIDITNYSTVHIEYTINSTDYSKDLDISNVSGSMYILLYSWTNSGGAVTVELSVSPTVAASDSATNISIGTSGMSLNVPVSISALYVS